MRILLAMLVLGGCARAGSDTSNGGADAPADAPVLPDPIADARPDAPRPPDAPPPPPPDSCVPITTQLLANPLLDGAPQGAGWTEQLIHSGYELITSDDGQPEHTAPFKAWLGGFEGNNVTDVLRQDVAIPPMTSELVLTGFHDVRTDEDSDETTAFDTATVLMTQINGTPIETAFAASNLTPKTSWTPFNYTFTQNLSGQTIRLRLTSTNDGSYSTSFYFDTLALTATHGCP